MLLIQIVKEVSNPFEIDTEFCPLVCWFYIISILDLHMHRVRFDFEDAPNSVEIDVTEFCCLEKC